MAVPHDNLPTTLVRVLRGHRAPVQCARFNAAGTYALTGSEDRSVCLWNPYRPPEGADTGALLLQRYEGPGQEVRDIAPSPDGARFVAVGGDRCAFLFDVSTGAVLRRIWGHDARINTVALAGAEGATLVVTGSDDKSVRVVDLRAGGGGRGAAQVLTGARDAVSRVLLADGGTTIIAASLDGTLRSWDARVAHVNIDTLPGGLPLADAALSSDGHCVLGATTRFGGALALIERRGGSVLATYAGHANAEYRCHPSLVAGDAHVVCGSETGDVHFWPLVGPAAAQPSCSLTGVHKRVVSWVEAHALPGAAGRSWVSRASRAMAARGGGGVDAPPSVLLSASFDGSVKLWAPAAAMSDLAMLASTPDGSDDPALRRALGEA